MGIITPADFSAVPNDPSSAARVANTVAFQAMLDQQRTNGDVIMGTGGTRYFFDDTGLSQVKNGVGPDKWIIKGMGDVWDFSGSGMSRTFQG